MMRFSESRQSLSHRLKVLSLLLTGCRLTLTDSVDAYSSSAQQAPQQMVPDYTGTTAHSLTRSKVDAMADFQPIDTVVGDFLNRQFVHNIGSGSAASSASELIKPPMSQTALNTAFTCPQILLPGTIILEAPTGCSSTGRTGNAMDATGKPILKWSEICMQLFSPDMSLTDVRTGKSVSQFQTDFTRGSNAIDLYDCNNENAYTIYESIYNMVGQDYKKCGGGSSLFSSCAGEIYLRYVIASKTGKTVAYTPYLPVYTSSFKLIDSNSGTEVAKLNKNGDWSSKVACPSYSKRWYIEFNSLPSVAPGSEAARFANNDARWVTVALLSVMGLRDESRNNDGTVSWSVCKSESAVGAIVVMSAAGLLVVLFGILWVRLRWRQYTTKYLFRLQERILPHTKNSPS